MGVPEEKSFAITDPKLRAVHWVDLGGRCKHKVSVAGFPAPTAKRCYGHHMMAHGGDWRVARTVNS